MTRSNPLAELSLVNVGKRRRAIARRSLVGYGFVFPSLCFAAVFLYGPALSAVYHAFTNWDGFSPPQFIGLENFRLLAGDPVFLQSLLNVVKLAGWGVLVELTVPLLVARLIFGLRSFVAQYWMRMVFVVPLVVPTVVFVLVWGFFYSPLGGLIDALLHGVGLGALARPWLGDPHTALYAIMFMGFPWVDGFGLLIYTAGLQAIPDEVREAADMDGASKLRRFFRIELPLLSGQLRLLLLLTVINTLSTFTQVLILTNGGPGNATILPGLVIYQDAFLNQQFGYASAIGVVVFALTLVVNVAITRILRPVEF